MRNMICTILGTLLIASTAILGCSDDTQSTDTDQNKTSTTDNHGNQDDPTKPGQTDDPVIDELCTVYVDCEEGKEACEELVPCSDKDEDTEIKDTPHEDTPELCSDHQDNDNNGKVDCDDPVCRTLSVCDGWESAENTPETCSDGKDNDDDFETDCEDADCEAYCKDEDDPDWQAPGQSCKASELGMIAGSSDKNDAGNNFLILKDLVEGNGECTTLILDGEYHFAGATKDGKGNIKVSTDAEIADITLNRVFKIMGTPKENGVHTGVINADKNVIGFRFKDKSGIILDNLKLESNYPYGTRHFLDASTDFGKFHGTADRIMIRDCEVYWSGFLKISGVHQHYSEQDGKYSGADITEEEIPEYSTRFRRITLKNNIGKKMTAYLSDMAILDKFEIIGNVITLHTFGAFVSWGTNNSVKLSGKIQRQGNAHIIFRKNKVSGPSDIIEKGNGSYYTPLLSENTVTNFEDNIIENFMGRSKAQDYDEKTGEPQTKAAAPVYDSYMNTPYVLSRNNTIKNVFGLTSHYSQGTRYSDLMKSKGGASGIKRFINNTYIVEKDMVMKHLNRLIDGGTFEDGTTIGPMYIADGKGGKKLLRESEKELNEYIEKNTCWNLFTGVSLYNMQEITMSGNSFNLEGLDLHGSYYFMTRLFKANGNTFNIRSTGKAASYQAYLTYVFNVAPFKYGPNQTPHYTTYNQALETTVQVHDNVFNIENMDEIVLVNVNKPHSTMPSYQDTNGTVHELELDKSKVTFDIENNKGNNHTLVLKKRIYGEETVLP